MYLLLQQIYLSEYFDDTRVAVCLHLGGPYHSHLNFTHSGEDDRNADVSVLARLELETNKNVRKRVWYEITW